MCAIELKNEVACIYKISRTKSDDRTMNEKRKKNGKMSAT